MHTCLPAKHSLHSMRRDALQNPKSWGAVCFPSQQQTQDPTCPCTLMFLHRRGLFARWAGPRPAGGSVSPDALLLQFHNKLCTRTFLFITFQNYKSAGSTSTCLGAEEPCMYRVAYISSVYRATCLRDKTEMEYPLWRCTTYDIFWHEKLGRTHANVMHAANIPQTCHVNSLVMETFHGEGLVFCSLK